MRFSSTRPSQSSQHLVICTMKGKSLRYYSYFNNIMLQRHLLCWSNEYYLVEDWVKFIPLLSCILMMQSHNCAIFPCEGAASCYSCCFPVFFCSGKIKGDEARHAVT